jgi:hypothetical protein
MTSHKHKHVQLPPDDIADWFSMPFYTHRHWPDMEFYGWLENETVGRYYKTHSHIYFEYEEDAVMYALRWI